MEIKSGNKHTLFLPAFIDDYGLTPEEFRVFGRIMRRSYGSERGCFESVPNMSESLKIGVNLIRQALRVLEACGAITRVERPGKVDLLDFNACDKWKPAAELPKIRDAFENERKRKDRDRKNRLKIDRVVTETGGAGGHGKRRAAVTENAGAVVTETPDEGIPSEGQSLKEEGAKNAPAAAAKSASVKQPTALVLYRGFYPQFRLTVYQTGLLGETVEPAAFRKALEYWAAKGYQERNLIGIFDRYRQELARAAELPPAAPSPTAFCELCRETSGLIGFEGGYRKCGH